MNKDDPKADYTAISDIHEWAALPKEVIAAWWSLLAAHKVVTDAVNKDLSEGTPLTLAEFEIIRFIERAKDGQIRFNRLSSLTLLSSSQVSRRVAALQDKGYVSRVTKDTDRRATFAVLTDKGREAYKDAQDIFLGSFKRNFLDLLPPARLKEFTEPLMRLAKTSHLPR